jgi:ribosomal protein L33
MASLVPLECVECGNRFELVLLSEKEQRTEERERRLVIAPFCQRCRSHNLRKI